MTSLLRIAFRSRQQNDDLAAVAASLVVLLVALNTAACVAVEFRTQKRSQDVKAGSNMRLLVQLQEGCRARVGRYATTFGELQLPPRMGLHFDGAEGCGYGYCYLLTTDLAGYELWAWPDQRASGYRSFYADQSGIVRYTTEFRKADNRDPEVPPLRYQAEP